MQANLEVDGRCSCGRSLAAAAIYSYRSRTNRYVFHRCGCGREWTERQTCIDQAEPVGSDELIEVHTHLATFEGPISELLHRSA